MRQQLEELGELANDLPGRLDAALTAKEIASLHNLVSTQIAALDHAFTQAAANVDASSLKLTRTRHRGIYRSNTHYVVLYHDEHGSERQREFDTATAARDFLTLQRGGKRPRRDHDGMIVTPSGTQALDMWFARFRPGPRRRRST